jgi:hypothetical protein
MLFKAAVEISLIIKNDALSGRSLYIRTLSDLHT